MNASASIFAVNTSNTFRPDYVSANLQYAISDNKLFKYRNMAFEQVYQFPPNDRYKMVNI
jgi:hypothetical protein